MSESLFTPERRAAAKTRCEAATPGPWYWEGDHDLPEGTDPNYNSIGPDSLSSGYRHGTRVIDALSKCECGSDDGDNNNAFLVIFLNDKAFIEKSRIDLPDALAELARQDASIAELEHLLDRWQAAIGTSLENAEELARSEKGTP